MEPKRAYKSFHYKAKTTWSSARRGVLSAAGRPNIVVSSPPEFKGEPDIWAPEELLVGSLNTCMMLTFLTLAQVRGLTPVGYESEAEGLLENVEGKYHITEVTVRPRVILKSEAELEPARKTMESVEAHCFIANSINARVTLTRSLSLLPHQSENVLPIKRTLNRLENGTVVTVASRDQEVPGFRPYFVFSAILSLFFSKITLFFGAKDRSRSSETSALGEVIADSLTPPRRGAQSILDTQKAIDLAGQTNDHIVERFVTRHPDRFRALCCGGTAISQGCRRRAGACGHQSHFLSQNGFHLDCSWLGTTKKAFFGVEVVLPAYYAVRY